MAKIAHSELRSHTMRYCHITKTK